MAPESPELKCAAFFKDMVGAVAQLGERLNGIQEVVGSIPISSTIEIKGLRIPRDPFFAEREKMTSNTHSVSFS